MRISPRLKKLEQQPKRRPPAVEQLSDAELWTVLRDAGFDVGPWSTNAELAAIAAGASVNVDR